MKSGMTLDTSEFDKQIHIYTHVVVPGATKEGMKEALMQLMDDVSLVEPTAPLLDSFLRGSGSAFVQNELVAFSKHGIITDKQVTEHKEPIADGNIVGVVGYNRPYAARWHEVEPDGGFKVSGCGKKYLEAKLAMFGGKYVKIIAGKLQQAHSSGHSWMSGFGTSPRVGG